MTSAFVCRRFLRSEHSHVQLPRSAHREEIQTLRQRFTARSEWPTWLLLIFVYSAWFGVLSSSAWLGVGWSTLLLIPLVVLWMSVQHELLHGHPTRSIWLNKTVLGRFVIGAPLALLALAREELLRLRRGERQAWLMWLTHGALTLLMLEFIARYSVVPVWHYLLLISVPALSLAMVRSYYEHRPHLRPEQRTVLNEAGWPWRWLFLNLNLHLVHHDLPKVPWYDLPRVYRARREQWQARSGGFVVQGYGPLWRQHGLKAIDSPLHPFS